MRLADALTIIIINTIIIIIIRIGGTIHARVQNTVNSAFCNMKLLHTQNTRQHNDCL